MTRIMIIRHAEKPSGDGLVHGVTHAGAHDKHDLSVRGWQRAGALVRFFAPHDPAHAHAGISTPCAIFAAAATLESPSLRSQHTVHPLAAALDLHVVAGHPEGDERGVAAAVLAADGPVLIAWHHRRIHALVRAIAGEHFGCPAKWPDERFDVVWVLDRPDDRSPWAFSQVVQGLLPHDLPDPIPEPFKILTPP